MLALWNYFRLHCAKLLPDSKGQTTFEYVIAIVLVAIAIFISSPNVSNAIVSVLFGTSSLLTDAMSQ